MSPVIDWFAVNKEITIAIFTLLGIVLGAMFANWDKNLQSR